LAWCWERLSGISAKDKVALALNKLILFKDRAVLPPPSFSKEALEELHSAHQGVTSMFIVVELSTGAGCQFIRIALMGQTLISYQRTINLNHRKSVLILTEQNKTI
jgi:hypothetical protein